MKKSSLIILFSYSLIFFTSCGPQKTETQGAVQDEQVVNEVHAMPDYAYTDSMMQGSHKVVYSIIGKGDEEQPVVVDEDGVKYMDNSWQLVITKDGKKLFEHSFTKTDFKSQLPEDFKKYGIMDGLRFNRAEEGKLYFNTCVSYPESDMSCPFILTVGPDGSYTIAPDNSVEEDDEFPSI